MRQGLIGSSGQAGEWGHSRNRLLRKAALLAALVLTAGASPATASVPLGQLYPGTPVAGFCTPDYDHAQETVSSGTSYTVPATGTITSWSTNAAAGAGQEYTMKVFRVSGSTFSVVGRDGPRPLVASSVNTFASNIAVKPGDLLGLHTVAATPSTTCADFTALAAGDQRISFSGDLAVGSSGTFFSVTNQRLNIAAVLEPSNAFSIGAAQPNKKKGTATLTVNVSNPGELALSGDGVKSATGAGAATTAPAPGDVELLVKATGKKRKALNKTGKVKLDVGVTYTPTGGAASTQATKLKLKLKLKKR